MHQNISKYFKCNQTCSLSILKQIQVRNDYYYNSYDEIRYYCSLFNICVNKCAYYRGVVLNDIGCASVKPHHIYFQFFFIFIY